MSDYDQIAFIPAILVIALVTFPLWFPIWAIWIVFDKVFSKKEDLKKVIEEKYISVQPKSGPHLFHSISEKNKFYNDQTDHG